MSSICKSFYCAPVSRGAGGFYPSRVPLARDRGFDIMSELHISAVRYTVSGYAPWSRATASYASVGQKAVGQSREKSAQLRLPYSGSERVELPRSTRAHLSGVEPFRECLCENAAIPGVFHFQMMMVTTKVYLQQRAEASEAARALARIPSTSP